MTEDVGDQPAADRESAHETRLLSEREGRRAARSRVEAVPDALRSPLQQWLRRFLHRSSQLEERITVRLGLELTPRDRIPSSVGPPWELARHPALERNDDLLLDAIDLALQWDEALANQVGLQELLPATDDGEPDPRFTRLPDLTRLDQLLDDGGSTHQVWVLPGAATPMLTVRVDPTVQVNAEQAILTAEAKAAKRLRSAWSKAYGRETEADGAYADAVRAVEVAISTVVSPDNDRQTLGTAVRDLRNGAHKYELVLLAKDGDGSVEPLLLLLERLWEGQKSRHGAGYGARPSTLEEARAAVHVAVLVVQWLTDGVLRRRTPTGTS